MKIKIENYLGWRIAVLKYKISRIPYIKITFRIKLYRNIEFFFVNIESLFNHRKWDLITKMYYEN